MQEKTYFIDADVFINAFVNLDSKKHQKSRELIRMLEQGNISLATDFLVLIEVYYILSKYKNDVLAVRIVKNLLSNYYLEIVPIDSYIFFESLKRVGKYKFKINDLIHYTVALLKVVNAIYSYDRDFDRLEIERVEP